MNAITNEKANLVLELSNGATTTLTNAIVMAGSQLAQTDWQRQFVCWIAEHDQEILGLGMVGFDVLEIAWSTLEFASQKRFVLQVTDQAASPSLLERLGYGATDAPQWLAQFANLVQAVQEADIDDHTWKFEFGEPDFAQCETHNVYLHAAGCALCNADE